MENKKFEFTGETKDFDGVTLKRIVAVDAFGFISSGEKGGWIEKEESLSHSGDAWIAHEAIV